MVMDRFVAVVEQELTTCALVAPIGAMEDHATPIAAPLEDLGNPWSPGTTNLPDIRDRWRQGGAGGARVGRCRRR
jgi:hypothetical protein